ncbi:MAG TPA: GH92 family glycosyl hydrolase [Chitinophaga sp.]|uniref:GH92 family glycosyl hydrolase n=1 Tax=Chitinophaga sp. TaxID=1869181 RepID=UPI002DC04605|nr:GH92 family glycosyl hydrolase [Chitinophaga sp.]HEU4551498.1 GH92 family glycosyl hydrolase [Chitinophaga sp.]
MTHVRNRYYLLTAISLLTTTLSVAQVKDPVSYVDPFIGTAKSNVITKWGNEGGTYPGAVAPWGNIQLTPETRVNAGYDYADGDIVYFSCLRHHSGFPGGSAGQLYIMPVNSNDSFHLGTYHRRFSHAEEKASPGYYRVLFPDNNTLVEATATTRTGFFRFTFAPGVTPQLFIGDGKRFNTVTRFNLAYTHRAAVEGGSLFTFAAAAAGPTILWLKLSTSTAGQEIAARNIAVELDTTFDGIRERTRAAWTKVLSVVDVQDNDEAHKTIFYTALYHSLLMPWIISDTDGGYRGADGKIYPVSGAAQYGGFSPWDTFRSLHPLLCLLFPSVQRDMVLSMLDVFQQAGHLPTESMTGNHAVPIIADTYLKGMGGIDAGLAFKAMLKSHADTPFLQPDLQVYQQQGYIPFTWPESVTRTVEYAYDDWVLGQFAARVMHNDSIARACLQRSYAYRRLFRPDEMLLLPRAGNEYKLQPGTTGYKEGDAWAYTYFVPQHPQDLVNLMGGPQLFAQRLDDALTSQQIIFDNETVFQVPWLFNAAGYPHYTQKWIREITYRRFSATPGGLPGNDDLGSTSSWYVLSALGIYPLCPGRPEYTLGTPLFRSAALHLENGRTFTIQRSAGAGAYIRNVRLDKQPYNHIYIPHARIMQGGKMLVNAGTAPVRKWPLHDSAAEGRPDFHLLQYNVSARSVTPHKPFWLRFTLHNNGSLGTKQVQVMVNNRLYAVKNCLVDSRATITDSVSLRLYELGTASITLKDQPAQTPLAVTVTRPAQPFPLWPDIQALALRPLVARGDTQHITFTAQNIGGETRTWQLPVRLQDSIITRVQLTLQPGRQQTVTRQLVAQEAGWQLLRVGNAAQRFRVYTHPLETLLLNLEPRAADTVVADHSGFNNNARVIGRQSIAGAEKGLLLGNDCYAEVPNAPSLDVMGNTLTMMAWVYPQMPGTKAARGLVDIFTKGDTHVLQVAGNKTLTFFAGGWGRGDVSAPLPGNWFNHWHHIAGVCDGAGLRLYIDGELKGAASLEKPVNLSVPNKWTLGRNEEFPGTRIFNGYMNGVKVYASPLSSREIKQAMGAAPAWQR